MTKNHKKLAKGKKALGIAALVLGLAGVFTSHNAHAAAFIPQKDQASIVVSMPNFFCYGYWSPYPCRFLAPSYSSYPWFPSYPWPYHYPRFPHYPGFPHYPHFPGNPGGPIHPDGPVNR